MKKLEGKVVVASGASRGAGRGIARVLGEAGATVYVVARTSRGGPPPEDGFPQVEAGYDELSEPSPAIFGIPLSRLRNDR